MALKVELKPNERIIIGQALIRNGDSRIRFFIEGTAPILREKDILTANTADSPAKRIYLAVQLMYLDGGIGSHHDLYFQLVRDFLGAAPSATGFVAEINNRILNGEFYKALKAAKELVGYEQKLIDHAKRGAGVRQDGPADPHGS